MFAVFISVRREGVTNFGAVVTALVISTLLPFSMGVWPVASVSAEEASLPMRLSRHIPVEPLPTPLGADAIKADTGLLGEVSSEISISEDRQTTPGESAGQLPREQRIRLARFLPAPSATVTPLDSLLAKAYTVRSSREGKERGAVRVYRSGKEVTQGAAPADEGEADASALSTLSVPASSSPSAEQVLAEGDASLAQSRVSEAFLAYFAIVNTWPASSESLAVDAALNNLVWDADRGIADVDELRAFTDALPPYAECASDKAVYWLVAAYQVTGHAMLASGGSKDAQAYLEYSRDTALSAMRDFSDSPYQLFIPGHYLLSCRDLGRSELDTGMARLQLVISGETSNSMLKFAARHALATHYNSAYNDIVEGSVQAMNVVDEYSGSVPERMLQEETASPNLRAHLNFGLGYIHYQMGQFGTARRYFEAAPAADGDNRRLGDASAYMTAYMTELADLSRTERILTAYYGYMDAWPDGEYLDKALMRVASVLDQSGNLRDAARTFRTLLDLFPGASWADNIQQIAKDLEASIAAGMEEQRRGDALVAEYGMEWCGPYALALLLESQGKDADLRALAEDSGMDYSGTSLAGLQAAAVAAGLTTYGVQVSGAASLTAPSVAHLSPNHFVYVSTVTPTDIRVEDLQGRHIVSHEDFDALFSGYALLLSEPDVDTGVDTATLETIRGGQSEGWYIDLTETYMQCINQDRPEICPPVPPDDGTPSTGGGRGNNPTSAPHSKGTSSPGDIHNGPYVNTPGAMADPANPSVNPNIPFGGSALTVSMGTNHRAMSMMQTDIHVPTRGTMDFSFRRVYYNPWGKHRDYMASETRPYKNNIGNGWRHNFNVHVRLSSANGYLAYVDANGNFKRFTRSDTNVNGYDLYQRAPLDMDEEDINALRTERAIRARRHVQEGWVEIEFPDGITCRFSAPINDLERYCRLESFHDTSYVPNPQYPDEEHKFTLHYDDLWIHTPTPGDENLYTNFGRLSQVTAPSGDDRYLQFYYSGNLIERVDLLQPDGAGTELLKKVEYSYGPYKTGQGTPYNYLRSVEIDDNPDDTVYFEYEEGVYDNTVVGMYPSKITDKEGNQLEIACTYGYVPGNNFISTTETALTFPDGLTTVYEKTYKDYTDVRNYDGATVLSRFFFKVDGHGVRVDYARYYHEPGGATYDQWNYYYENNYDLTAVGNVAVQYWYNDDGRVTKYACGYIYYRYEYPAGGGLYPIRQYGPGTADDLYKGPMTEFVYDAYDRLVQVKPPDMGSNGLSIAYDAYGQVTSRTNAAGDTQSYTYDSRGNLTSHTDYESNTWTYTYDDLGRMITQTDPASRTTTYTYTGGCPSCGGASGQIASITLPDNRQLFFDYDNNGNLILQTDPLGHETAYSYDGMGRLVSVLTEEGRQQTFTYDTLGNMTSKTDFGGKTTHYEYDYRGLMTRTWLQVGAVEDTLVENEYNISGWLVKVTDGEGQDINFAYNERGQVTRTSHGEWCSLLDTCDFGALHIWNDYDQYGRLYRTRAETRTPSVNIFVDPIEYFYNDTTGQLTKKRTTNDNGAAVKDVDYYYDVNGKLARVDDWTGGSGNDGHEFAYDDNGRLDTYTDYDDAELSYTYDALGRPVAMDAYETGNSYGYAYNTAGQLSTITAPGNRQWGFNYDNAGQLSNYTWPNGQRTEYTYDDDGRLTGLVHKDSPASGARTGWQYVLGDDGNILRMVDARSAYQADREYEYDHRDRLIRSNWWQTDGSPHLRMVYTYDDADNMLSQTRYSFTSRVYDAFTDGDYTSSPAWTVESGTWSAASGALVPTPQSGVRAISTANTYGNADVWYAFKRTGTGGALDNALVQLRYVDENNWLGVRFMWNMLIVVEKVSGVEQDLAYTAVNSFAAQDVWYDIYVQLDGSSVVLFACERGDSVQRLLDTSTNLGASTSALRVRVNGVMPFEFDEFRVCSRSIHAGQSMVFTYGPANQMATMTTSGVTSSFSYDPWGRLASRSATIGGQSYTATYTYRWGDKLQRIDSDFPGETPVVQYNYDGLGKRRLKAVGNDTTYWRWDAGYAVLAQYGDSSPDWNISGFDRFFVPFGHTALAEADLDASGVPANAAYTYLAHDHLGTSTHGFDQSKTVVSQNVHLPFGQRTYASGNSPYHEFTGKPWDAEAQLYYFPYRYYSPNMNRWTMPDPLGLVDGPNVYAYVGGKPTSRFDRLGLQIYSCRGCRGKTVVRCDKPGRYTSFCSGLDPIDTAACESAIDDLCKEIKYRRNCCMADFSHCSVCNEPCILQCLENFNICLGSGYATIPDRLKPKN